MPLALLLDDDSILEAWAFASKCHELSEITLDTIHNYINLANGSVHGDKRLTSIFTTSESAPIFWQFIGMSGSNYGILEHLDTMPGQLIDNANFFALDDIDSIRDDELYQRLLGEFPNWLKEAKDLKFVCIKLQKTLGYNFCLCFERSDGRDNGRKTSKSSGNRPDSKAHPPLFCANSSNADGQLSLQYC